ncbi:MAG TPA: hypothetical protein PKC49_09935 [Phycisphaerae bacterium]|nr:hypothetical protein [Phycisphaerae bacterium]
MSSINSLVAAVSTATLLALAAFVGFLAATGRLNAERLELIAQVLRGELSGQPAEAHDAHAPAAAATATQPAHGQRSADELQAQRDHERAVRTSAERALRDVAAQRELLEQALGHLVREQERFEQSKAQWAQTREKLQQQDRDAGFEEELKLVSKLPPQQAKEHLVLTWKKSPADAVRLVKALSPSRSQRILEQLKTPDELQVLHELLEQLRKLDIDKLAPESGKTSGDTGH